MYETAEERAALFDFTGKYTELDLLNKKATGFGWAVLVADNFEDQRRKVIKLPNSQSATRELLVEAKILTKIAEYLRHPNLVSLHSVDKYVIEWDGKREDRWFLVLQYGGNNLRSRLGRLGLRDNQYVYLDGEPLSVEETLDLAIQITDGLRALHEFEESPGQHIIHRDIKPENILLDAEGTARLTDFGISKIVERVTQSVTAAGTPPYLAPEYSRGRLHACSDIYSLGIVLYEMATGRFPFRTLQDRFYDMPEEPVKVNPNVPARLSEIILRCLHWNACAEREKEEADRYQAASELLDDLRRCYSRLYPVPPRFKQISEQGSLTTLFRDTESAENVRVFVYRTEQSNACCTRLSRVQQNMEGVLVPKDVFASEETIGVVAPLPPDAKCLADTAVPADGVGCYRFVSDVARLVERLKALHVLGVYHGFLSPFNVTQHEGQWWLDQVWLGQLTGLVEFTELLGKESPVAGYVAPEILRGGSAASVGSDIYGIGAILFGSLTGLPPIDPEEAYAGASSDGTTRSNRALSGVRQHASFVSRRLETLIIKALQTDQMCRHRTMDELLADLRACTWPEDMVLTCVEDAKEAQKQNNLIEAYDALDNALLLDPGNPIVHHTRAEIFFLEGESKWAWKENEKALQIQPTPSVWFLHGQCLAAMEDYEEAERCFREGLKLEDSSRGRHLLARCLEKVGREEMAIQEYQHAVQLAESSDDSDFLSQEIKADLTALLERMKG